MPRSPTPTSSASASAPEPEATGTHRPGLRFGRRGCAVLVVAAVVCLFLCRRPLLEAAAGILIVDQTPGDVDYVLVQGGHDCYDEAASLHHEVPSRRILLLAPRPGRLQRLGILSTFEDDGQRALEARGVPRDAVEVIAWKPGDPPIPTDRLGVWMEAHPQGRILLLCDRFGSRCQRRALDSRLEPDLAARIAVRGMPDRRYDETNWWQSRRGAKEWVLKGMVLAYVWCRGEDAEDPQDWDPSEYERALRVAPGEVAR